MAEEFESWSKSLEEKNRGINRNGNYWVKPLTGLLKTIIANTQDVNIRGLAKTSLRELEAFEKLTNPKAKSVRCDKYEKYSYELHLALSTRATLLNRH